LKKIIPDLPIRNRNWAYGFSNPEINIYANSASGTPPHPKCNMIHFRIDESVAHFEIPKLWGLVLEFTKLWDAGRKM